MTKLQSEGKQEEEEAAVERIRSSKLGKEEKSFQVMQHECVYVFGEGDATGGSRKKSFYKGLPSPASNEVAVG